MVLRGAPSMTRNGLSTAIVRVASCPTCCVKSSIAAENRGRPLDRVVRVGGDQSDEPRAGSIARHDHRHAGRNHQRRLPAVIWRAAPASTHSCGRVIEP